MSAFNVPYMKLSGLANFLKTTLGPKLYRIPIILVLSSCLYFAFGAKLNSLQGRVGLFIYRIYLFEVQDLERAKEEVAHPNIFVTPTMPTSSQLARFMTVINYVPLKMDARFLLCLQCFSKFNFQGKYPFQCITTKRKFIERRMHAPQFFICLIKKKK